jgi:cytochrome b
MKTTTVRLWDLPTRVFHWLLAAGIAFSWFSAEIGGNWMEWHERSGIFLLSLILFRIVWGFVGSETSRFAHFIRSPAAAIQYWKAAKTQPKGTSAYYAGHNPMGAWMVIALLGIIGLQGLTGLFATDDIATEGPLAALVSSDTAELLTTLHHAIFNLVLLFAVIHIAAVIFYRLVKRTNLIKAMVVGTADWPAAQSQPTGLQFKPTWLGVGVFALCYVAVYFCIKVLAA